MFSILCGLIGAAVGTILAVCVERLPSSRPILSPLHCPTCGHRFSTADLIPILGRMIQRGRCRHCATLLSGRIYLIQALTGALFALFAFYYGPDVPLVFALIHLCFLIVIAVVDLEHQLILNRTVYPAMGIALLGAVVLPDLHLRQALLGGLVGFAIFFGIVFAYPSGMGMGDARLATYIGLVLGMPKVVLALLLAILLAGIAAIILIVARVRNRKDAIPFGPFLVVGGLIAMLYWEHILRWLLL